MSGGPAPAPVPTTHPKSIWGRPADRGRVAGVSDDIHDLPIHLSLFY